MSQDPRSAEDRHGDSALSRPMSVPWPPLLLIGAIAGAILLEWLAPVNWPGHRDMPARIVGLGIGIAGLLSILWAVYSLYRARTTLLPHEGARTLVQSGPFVRFRNPIYLGDTMLLLAAAELTGNVWFVATAPLFAIAVTLLAILPEERHLEEKFGENYRAYKARTRRWI